MQRASGHTKLVEGKRGAVWYVKYRYPDASAPGGIRQTTKALGPAWKERGRPPAGYFTKKTAKDALDELLADARRGTLEGVGRSGATFEDAAAEYLRFVQDVRQIDAATVDDYRGVIHGYLLDNDRLAELGVQPWADRPVEAITADDVEAYKEALVAAGKLSSRTIVRHLTVLHGIFKRAQRAFGLTRNPASADLVERPRVTYTGEFDTFDREELDLLLAHADDQQDAALYLSAAFTGLRQGELLALRWRDVAFVDGLLHVRRNYTDRREKVPKGRKVRSVPMTAEVIDALARLKDRAENVGEEDLVFCNDAGDYLDSWALRRRFYRVLERAGLRRIRFHDLRHIFGSTAVTVLDGYTLQSYMGHAHYSTTQRYLHHKPKREHAQLLGQAFAPTDTLSRIVSPTAENGAELSATQEAESR